MLEREKFCSKSAIATALAVSDENQTIHDDEATKLSLHLPNKGYTCNPDNIYTVPHVNLHEVEWIEAASIDIPKFVASSSIATTTTTTTRNNPRRWCRTSTSSGYSSHSPPLSAGSYSYYASAISGPSFFRSTPLTMKHQFDSGLAVIHESDTIPPPIWPTAFRNAHELCHNNENCEYDSLYTCCGCRCTYSYCDLDSEKKTYTSAYDVLLELSTTLNSVIEGKNDMTPEEILHKISHKVAQGIGLKGELYEYVYHNSSFLPTKRLFTSDKNSCLLNYSTNSTSKINPVNSKLYNNSRHFCLHNPSWYSCLCSCEHTTKFISPSKNDEQIDINDALQRKEIPSAVLLIDNHYQRKISEAALQNSKSTFTKHISRCLNHPMIHDKMLLNMHTNYHTMNGKKGTINVNKGTNEDKKIVASNETRYAMQLECNNDETLNKGIGFTPRRNNWDYRMQGYAKDLDFTLDVSRAEHLGRTIAKAKRKRQWCRVLTAIFGLVFFVLSVVIVSLTVTRGRKVFGSM